ncbi:sulfatase-like hydrolase/transferase [Pseudomonas sp. MYb185]|uniref:sulfatase-like hydrolase/transferase n=1 Tax=Pseudomonas sp. MYb185 TaxID=1848729 RepID=UPI000CFCFFD0|nr:sulfatase-like hydrolase/transferase [Pseudomonas sp. MYb185]PRB84665.1 arylsulfatase [Pseudomonas sp. MYb185]
MQSRLFKTGALLIATLALASCKFGSSSSSSSSNDPPTADQPPNILFVIMDDVGIDQMESFGYGGIKPPAVPSIDAIADGGIRFRNTWAMPECSPSRATFMTGLYPMRTDVLQAIGPDDLANSHVSPYAMTIPKVLATAGYENGMFGKYHLGGPENSPAGFAAPAALGWEYFYGWGGLPASIDTTAGGVGEEGQYSCGFVPGPGAPGGVHAGACYIPQPGGGTSCTEMAGEVHGDPAGLRCLTEGGVLVPGQACETDPPTYVNFDRENAHYVSRLLVNWEGDVEDVSLIDPRSRGYRATIEVDSAIDWINTRSDDTPWMATLSFSSAHTPLQHPPADLVPSGAASILTPDCTSEAPINQRNITDAMIESLDTELGRLLVETGIATRGDDGSLNYDPDSSNTVVVVVGDNGSFAPTVKGGFDLTRAKGSAYQTGVWVPLVISGPMVEQPNRNVEHMINAVDLFQFFADVAGVDLEQVVPRGTDAEEMLSYLTNPGRDSVREVNFTHGALNILPNDGVNGPCVFRGNFCSHTPMSAQVCADNGGVWWGQGADVGANGVLKEVDHCWQVNQAIYEDAPAAYDQHKITMGATDYMAMRNDDYKLVRNEALDYDPAMDGSQLVKTEEFYRIDQAVPEADLDREGDDLLQQPGGLTAVEQEHFDELEYQLDLLLSSHKACPGDGNRDGVVDQEDIDNYMQLSSEWGQSSMYDFNHDGLTDAQDLAIIQANLGACPQ